MTADDVDRVVGELASSGRAVSARRNYLQVFKGFHRFLEVRKAAEIEAAFGVWLAFPLDEFNTARHVADDSPSADVPPGGGASGSVEYLKGRIATSPQVRAGRAGLRAVPDPPPTLRLPARNWTRSPPLSWGQRNPHTAAAFRKRPGALHPVLGVPAMLRRVIYTQLPLVVLGITGRAACGLEFLPI